VSEALHLQVHHSVQLQAILQAVAQPARHRRHRSHGAAHQGVRQSADVDSLRRHLTQDQLLGRVSVALLQSGGRCGAVAPVAEAAEGGGRAVVVEAEALEAKGQVEALQKAAGGGKAQHVQQAGRPLLHLALP
jgi:hypothetical protein